MIVYVHIRTDAACPHLTIAPDGTETRGRPDSDPLFVNLVPVRSITRTLRFADYYTHAQRVALRDYLYHLERKVGIGKVKIGNHLDTSPGFMVVATEWL